MSLEDIEREARRIAAEYLRGADAEAATTLAERRGLTARARADEKAKAAAREAARQLGLRRVATAAPGEMARLGKKGAAAAWAKIGTGRDKVLELKRRAAVRKRNARAKRQALIEAIRRAYERKARESK